MDTSDILPLSSARVDPLEHDLAEIGAAIELVSRGVATRVCLAGLTRPESVTGAMLAHARAAHVQFTLDRSTGAVTLTIGPRS